MLNKLLSLRRNRNGSCCVKKVLVLRIDCKLMISCPLDRGKLLFKSNTVVSATLTCTLLTRALSKEVPGRVPGHEKESAYC